MFMLCILKLKSFQCAIVILVNMSRDWRWKKIDSKIKHLSDVKFCKVSTGLFVLVYNWTEGRTNVGGKEWKITDSPNSKVRNEKAIICRNVYYFRLPFYVVNEVNCLKVLWCQQFKETLKSLIIKMILRRPTNQFNQFLTGLMFIKGKTDVS